MSDVVSPSAATSADSVAVSAPLSVWARLFDSLRLPTYRWFWSGLMGTFAAYSMMNIAQGWLVYDLTGSAAALGIVYSASGVSLLVFSLVGGVLWQTGSRSGGW